MIHLVRPHVPTGILAHDGRWSADRAIGAFGDDARFAAELAAIAHATALERLGAILAALGHGDADAAERNAYSLRSALLVFGRSPVFSATERLEASLGEGRFDEAEQGFGGVATVVLASVRALVAAADRRLAQSAAR